MVAFDFLDVEGHVVDAILDVELEQIIGGRKRFACQDCDYVKRVIVVPEELHGAENLFACTAAAPIAAITVMQMRRPVEAHSDSDIVRPEEIDPLLIKQGTVGLNAVGETNVPGIET